MNTPAPEFELPPIGAYGAYEAEATPTQHQPTQQTQHLRLVDLSGETLSNKHRRAAAAPTPRSKFAALSLSELLSLPPQEWLVDGLFPARGLSVIYGQPGSAKTFVVLDLSFCIARGGGEWFGRRTTGGAVVMVAGEGVQGLAGRARAYCAAHMNQDAEPVGELHVVPHPPNLFAGEAEGGEAEEFAAAISPLRPALVVIDTLARSSVGADENSARDMGSIIAAADAIGKKLGCLVLLVHHSGKAGGERGSSALRGACDSLFEVKRHDDGTRELVLGGFGAKVKDGAESDSIFFKLSSVGESCVVVPAAPVEAAPRRPKPKGANQQLAWELLGQAAKEAGASASTSEGRPKVTFSDLLSRWQGAVRDARKREPGELRRALRGMLESKLIESDAPGELTSSAKIWCA